MGKEVKERSSNTVASQPKPAVILPKTVDQQANLTYLERRELLWGLVSDVKHIDLLFLANLASAVISPEVVVAPEESSSSTGRVEKHACSKQRGGGGEGSGLPKNLWRKRELVVQQAAHVEEAKHPFNGCREDRRFGKKYVRRKKRKEYHMDSTSTSLDLVLKSSSKGIDSNAETHSKSERVEAMDGQEGSCSGMRKTREVKKNCGSVSQRETRQGKERACVGDATDSETEADYEAENTISEAVLTQAVLGPNVPGGEMIVSEEEEEEEGVSNASRCNQWWNFKTRPRTSRGTRRHVQWSNKRKRNCMAFEETQCNRKILLLAVEAITHQLGLLDVSMENDKSSYK